MTAQPTRDQLRALADAATPGPWEADYSEENNYSIKTPGTVWGDGYAWVSDPNNAAFIAAARTAVPQLLDQLDAAEARIGHLEDTARVLVREALAAEDKRDNHRRAKVEAEERINAVRELHEESTPINRAGWTYCRHCTAPTAKTYVLYPCATIRSLDGEDM